MDIGGITKKVLLNLLVKVLGEFVELDENNLSVAIISGQVALHNLKLRTDNIFKKFNFHIFHGTLKSLEITIPWNLVGSSWKIKLDGILIDMGPPPVQLSSANPRVKQHPFGNWSTDNLQELIQKEMDEKIQKLKLIDEYLEFSHGMLISGQVENGVDGNGAESYIQQLTTRIIDNIEISLTNIHVRYEDSLSITGTRFAAGITLEAFNISTCDDNWQPAFVNKTDNGSSAACVKKLATLQSLGIYWEVNSESIADLPYENWKSAMLDLVHSGIKPPSRPLNYILAPAGSGMYMKFTHFKRPALGMPRFDILAESNDIKLNIDNTQYRQLFHFLDNLKRKTSQQFHDPNLYQPAERPIGGQRRNIRRWWQYAKTLVLLRKKYVRLIKLKKKAQAEMQELEWYLTREEMIELSRIEERLPLDVLKKFRQHSIIEFYRENKHLRPMSSEKEKSTGWFGWGGSTSTPSSNKTNVDAAIDLLSVDEVVEKIDRMEFEQSKKLFSSIKIQLSSSSTVILSTSRRKILECKGAMTVSLQKSNKLLTFGCYLTDIAIEDAMNISPFHPPILSVKPDSNESTMSSRIAKRPGEFKPTLSILIENLKGRRKISISALPVEIYLNKLCIQTLLGEFALPKKQIKQLKKVVNVERLDSETLETAILAGTKYSKQALKDIMSKNEEDVEVVLDIHAPKIIIPEDCTKDAGFLLLDCGLLKVNGILCSEGLSFVLSLTNVNAGLPFHVHDLYSLEDLQLYLIKVRTQYASL
jgi:vacuolar protein sorting-associated protein 13A/C